MITSLELFLRENNYYSHTSEYIANICRSTSWQLNMKVMFHLTSNWMVVHCVSPQKISRPWVVNLIQLDGEKSTDYEEPLKPWSLFYFFEGIRLRTWSVWKKNCVLLQLSRESPKPLHMLCQIFLGYFEQIITWRLGVWQIVPMLKSVESGYSSWSFFIYQNKNCQFFFFVKLKCKHYFMIAEIDLQIKYYTCRIY